MGKNGVIVIIVDDIKWSNEWNVQEQLGHSKLSNTASQYPKYLKKQRQELLKECFKQPCRRFLREDLGIQIIMDCRTIPAVMFKQRLGYSQYDVMMTQEQSVLTRLDTYFKSENKIFQHYVLDYRIDVHLNIN